ncbi:Pyrophosphate--fructose 6-phosphate 1-phosphotransferase subunit alpha 2, partial [Zea mays]
MDNGYMATVRNLKNPVNKWRCGVTPISLPFNQCHRVQGILPQDEGRLPQIYVWMMKTVLLDVKSTNTIVQIKYKIGALEGI